MHLSVLSSTTLWCYVMMNENELGGSQNLKTKGTINQLISRGEL